jgi:uncharacterized membrane protein YeaQ/YmgE (transglycosylase-associated protein family)
MATWFPASAVVPQLRAEWNLSSTGAAWLTIAVQLGFVAGALASSLLNVADVFSPQSVILAGALGAAAANALLGAAPAPARDRVLPGGCLSAGAEADGDLVPAAAGSGARDDRRRAHARLGAPPPRQRARRPRLARRDTRRRC